MSGIRESARLILVKAACGHTTSAYIPPGALGRVGRMNIEEARTKPCPQCISKGSAPAR